MSLGTEPSLTSPPAPSGFRRRWPWLLRSPGALFGVPVVLLVGITALFAPYVTPHNPFQQDLSLRLQPPFWGGRRRAISSLGNRSVWKGPVQQDYPGWPCFDHRRRVGGSALGRVGYSGWIDCGLFSRPRGRAHHGHCRCAIFVPFLIPGAGAELFVRSQPPQYSARTWLCGLGDLCTSHARRSSIDPGTRLHIGSPGHRMQHDAHHRAARPSPSCNPSYCRRHVADSMDDRRRSVSELLGDGRAAADSELGQYSCRRPLAYAELLVVRHVPWNRDHGDGAGPQHAGRLVARCFGSPITSTEWLEVS